MAWSATNWVYEPWWSECLEEEEEEEDGEGEEEEVKKEIEKLLTI